MILTALINCGIIFSINQVGKVYLILRVTCHAQKKLAHPSKRPWHHQPVQIPQVILLKWQIWRCSFKFIIYDKLLFEEKEMGHALAELNQGYGSVGQSFWVFLWSDSPLFIHVSIQHHHNYLCSAWLTAEKVHPEEISSWLWWLYLIPEPREKLKQRRIMRSCLKDGHHLNVLWKTLQIILNSKLL